MLVAKAEKKGRSREEVDQIISWLTGYTAREIEEARRNSATYGDFFILFHESLITLHIKHGLQVRGRTNFTRKPASLVFSLRLLQYTINAEGREFTMD